MKKIIMIALLISSALGSCSKLLDIEPRDIINPDTYYSTQKELEIGLNGVYATLAESSLYGNNMLGRMGLEGDEGYENYTIDQTGVGYYVVPASDPKILAYWRSLYSGINKANFLLAGVDRPQMNEIERANVRGQALFLRAYFYFMLVNKFGGVPMPLTYAPTTKAKDVQLPRSPADVVYRQIISDMEEAAMLVYPISQYAGGGRVSRSAVWGILSRVCLYAAGEPVRERALYEKAAAYADSVISTGLHDLNPSYRQVFVNYAQNIYDTKESIWEVEFWGNGTSAYTNTGGMVGRNNGIRNSSTVDDIGYAIGVIKATSMLYDLYDDLYTEKGKDTRRDRNIAAYFYRANAANPSITDTVRSGGGFDSYCAKFRRQDEKLTPKSPTVTPQNFPLLRYSDVLLMYAEAVNQKDSRTPAEIEKAYQCINQVRRRAYNVTTDSYDVKPAGFPVGEELLELIRNERARELCFESLRKNDLVRWGVFYSNMKYVLSLLPQNPSPTLQVPKDIYTNVTARDVIWPIPSYETGINKNLSQNPGW